MAVASSARRGLAHRAEPVGIEDRAEGTLVEVLAEANTRVIQPIHAVYYRNTALAARITCFLDYLSECLGEQEWTR